MNEFKKDWITKAGLRAVVLYVNDSHHCGYVALPKDHPLHGVPYSQKHPALRWEALEGQKMGSRGVFSLLKMACDKDEASASPDVFFDVHGSITYSDGGDSYPAKGDGLWWYGYDCAHAGDATNRYPSFDPEAVFRDLDYNIAQCESLAAQLEAVREIATRSAV